MFLSFISIQQTQTEENYAYHYGSETEKKIYSARNINIFYVRTDGWKRNVVRRGLAVFKQVNFNIDMMSYVCLQC